MRRSAGRWGLFAIALALAAALTASTASSYLAVKAVSAIVTKGQAEVFFHELRRQVLAGKAAPRVEDLDRVLAEQQAAGLRYIALVAERRRIVASSGAPKGNDRGGVADLPFEGEIRRIGERVRILAAPPPKPPGETDPPRDEAPPEDNPLPGNPPPNKEPPQRRPPAPLLLIELEPLEANRLEARALANLIASVAAAILLSTAAVALFRRAARADEAEEELARQRHLVSLGEMSAVLAHEIKNPLASLKGHAQLLAEVFPERDPDRDRADRVIDEALRLEVLTNQLLDMARKGTVDRVPVDPAALLADAVESAGSDQIALATDAAPRLWPLDPVRMRQVLINLLTNAIQASPKGALADASIHSDGERLIITIRDRGQGIPEAELERIFEPFHTTRTQGTGLGLTVVKRLVALHGGTVDCENHRDGGAVFRVAIPKA